MKKSALALAVLIALGAAACSRRPQTTPEVTNGVQIGTASWYGGEFQGRLTSNREIYNMDDMTAAHQTLPFGTWVMVTNLENEKTAVVRINDRGPFARGRIIDLSRAAARVLGLVGPGTARIRLEVLNGYKDTNNGSATPSAGPAESRFSVQVGAFAVQENAYTLKKRLESRYGGVYVSTYQTPNQVYYRVRVRAKDRDAALKSARKLSDEGFAVILLEE